MSDSSLHTNASTKQIQNENNDSKKNKNLQPAVHILDLDEKETKGEMSKSYTCIDKEKSIEPPADKCDNVSINVGKFIDLSGLKIKVMVQRPPRRIFTIMGIYDTIFGRGQENPPLNRPAYTSSLWRQDPPPQQPRQSVWRQYGPGPGQLQGEPKGYSRYGQYGRYGYGEKGPLMYNPHSRNSFVGLVMAIVFLMLAVTAAFLGVVLALPEVKEFFQNLGWLFFIPVIIGLVSVNYAMICSPCARKLPCNIVCLILATAAMSIFAAKVTSHYRTEIIFYAVIATGAVAFVCVLLACSKFDFTSFLLYIVAIATAFSVIVAIILITMIVTKTPMRPVIIVVLVVGTLIQISMLTMQLQMILGGRTIEISEADYALAAFLIYTSILDIFLKLVHIMGLLDR